VDDPGAIADVGQVSSEFIVLTVKASVVYG